MRERGKKIRVGLFSLISPLQSLDWALSPDTEWEAPASSTREEVLQVLLEPGSQANPMREACFMDGCTGDGNNVFLKMTGGVKSRKREYRVSLNFTRNTRHATLNKGMQLEGSDHQSSFRRTHG